MNTLKEQTAALDSEFRARVPDVMQAFDRSIEQLAATGIATTCLKVGDRIPEFSARDVHGQVVSAQSELEKGPLVISFYRGSWCFFDTVEHKALQESLPEIREKGAALIAITPQGATGTKQTLDELGCDYPLLSDPQNEIARRFGLTYELADELKPLFKDVLKIDLQRENGDSSFQLPMTATYVVNQDGVIVAAHVDPNFMVRMEPRDIVDAIPN
jgi:peroxiredoxin